MREENKNLEMVEEISLFELWESIQKHLLSIIAFSILLGGIIFLISTFVITPKYEARGTIIVGRNEKSNQAATGGDLNAGDIELNRRLVETYSVIMKSEVIEKEVINKLGLDLLPEHLKKMTNVSGLNRTEVLEVKVIDTIPERAMDIVNQTMEVFQIKVKDIMKVDNVQILDAANMPTKPISPKVIRNTALGVLIGLLLGAIIAVFKEALDTTIKSENDIRRITDLPIIGQVPYVKELD